MLHMHEVTGSSPVVPTTKKRKAFAFFFLYGGAGEPRARGKRTTKPRSRAQGRAERPAEGSPFGGVGGALLSPPQKKEGFCLLFFVRRRRRTSRPREKNDETAEQGAGSRGTPRRGVPLRGCRRSPVVPTTKKGRLLPSFFCAEAQANLAPAGKERRNRGAGRRVARNAPPRVPLGSVGGALLSPPEKRSGSRPFAAERADCFFRKVRSPFQMPSPL